MNPVPEASPFRPRTPAAGGRFARDRRFWPAAEGAAPSSPEPAPPAEDPPDPLEFARLEGYQAGRADALAQARAASEAEHAALAAFTLSVRRLDEAETQRLAVRLRETVEVLCHWLIADVALDPATLLRRAEAAARLLQRADDERTFRLNPEDLAVVGDRLPADWTVVPDAALERGAIRIETPSGGVEDGPGLWRTAVSEALRGC